MRLIVTHRSPDLDAITSVWLIKRFLQNWQEAKVEYVPAGSKLQANYVSQGLEIEELSNGDEVITVDTGLGKLDHHQLQENTVCAASLTYEFVKKTKDNGITTNEIKTRAIKKIVDFVIDDDHFQEVYYPKSTFAMFEFSFAALVNGYKLANPHNNDGCMKLGMDCLDMLLQYLENKLWAQQELNDKKNEFETRYGPGMAIESINDETLALAQNQGYRIVIRKDTNHGYIRIKASPKYRKTSPFGEDKNVEDVDLTPVYEMLKEKDPDATWYLHVSKKMLLNGSSKNPGMRGSKLSLEEVINIVKKI